MTHDREDAVELGTLCCCEEACAKQLAEQEHFEGIQEEAKLHYSDHAQRQLDIESGQALDRHAAEHVPNVADEQQRFDQAIEDLNRAEREFEAELAEWKQRPSELEEYAADCAQMQAQVEGFMQRARSAGIVPTVEEAAALAWLML